MYGTAHTQKKEIMTTTPPQPSKPIRRETTPDGVTTTWHADGSVDIDLSQVSDYSDDRYREVLSGTIGELIGGTAANENFDADNIIDTLLEAGVPKENLAGAIHASRLTGFVPGGLYTRKAEPEILDWWQSEAGLHQEVSSNGYARAADLIAVHVETAHEMIAEARSDEDRATTIGQVAQIIDQATARVATKAIMQVVAGLLDKMNRSERRKTLHRVHRIYQAGGIEQPIVSLDRWLREWPCECEHTPIDEFVPALFVTGALLTTGQVTVEHLDEAVEVDRVLRELF